MAQYYKPLLIDEFYHLTTYNRIINDKLIDGSLINHSLWDNDFVNSISSLLYDKKHQVAWVGDYAKYFYYYKMVWEKKSLSKEIGFIKFSLDNKYLINHSKNIYIDCNEYKLYNQINDNVLHPLPLLTAVGVRYGYMCDNIEYEEQIGIWAMDKLSISSYIPSNYQKISVYFKY